MQALTKLITGQILYHDSDIIGFGVRARRRFRRDVLGYLFQSYALIETATVAAATSNADATPPSRSPPPTDVVGAGPI